MKSWYEIYKERMNSAYLNHVANKYAPFILELCKIKGQQFTEVGCGAGTITRLLRETHSFEEYNKYYLIDSCPKMLGLAVENNPKPNCSFSVADVLSSSYRKFSDLVHSHGLLEHFQDDDIRKIVDMAAVVSPVQIHYVPSYKYEIPSRGDERLLRPEQWERILKGSGKILVSTFNDEHDIILRIES